MTSKPPHAILIVEDERIVAKDIQQTLGDLGYDAFAIASSAEEAIAHASERCPDLVLMDIRIKGQRDGIETAQILKTRFGIPVVFLTAHADEATLERAKKTEPHGYLLKPVRPAELRSVVEVSLYRHDMERRLRERERWFSTTLNSIADAVIAVDLTGHVKFMNPTAESLTGAQASTAIGKPIHDVLKLVSGMGESHESPVLYALREQRAVELQEGTLVNLSSGAVTVINDSAAPVMDEAQTLGAVMVFRDITEQRKLQKQLELSDRLVSLGTMAAGVAHEVNNPLSVVVANSGFLSTELGELRAWLSALGTQSEPVNQRMSEMCHALADVQSAAQRIGQIVSDLSGFSRPRPHEDGHIDINRCIEWAIRSTAHELRHRAQVTTTFAAIAPVRGDESRLGQVVINLLVNAAQAIEPGSVDRNSVSIETRMEHGRVMIEVRDSGCGMTDEVRNRVFDPFFTTKPAGVGTGLGLSISHGIVSSLKGEIQVNSEVGRGTTIRILLPAAASQPVKLVVPTPDSTTSHVGRILVVDDEQMVLTMIKRILREHDVCCVNSAREALTFIESGHVFDLIFSDLMMPNMTGMELYEHLLETKPDVARRMVFLSGGAVTDRGHAFLGSIPNRQVAKPFHVAQLREVVQQMLEAHVAGSNVAHE